MNILSGVRVRADYDGWYSPTDEQMTVVISEIIAVQETTHVLKPDHAKAISLLFMKNGKWLPFGLPYQLVVEAIDQAAQRSKAARHSSANSQSS